MTVDDQQSTVRDSSRSGPYVATVRWIEQRSEAQFGYLLVLPGLLLLSVVAFWPLFRTFTISLHSDSLLGAATVGDFVGVDNYVALLTGEQNALLPRPFLPTSFTVNAFVTSALTVTLIFTVISVTFETIIGFGQALVLDQEFKGRRWVRVAIIIPWAVPIVIQGMIFYLLFQPGIGFLVEPFQNLGVFSATPLANSVDSLIIVVFADIWKTSAFMALLILAGLQSINRDLYKVARVAGASKWQQFKMITLPLMMPTILVAVLFRTIAAMRIFGTIETIAGCNVVPSLSCLVVSTFSNHLYGSSAAVAFLTSIIIGGLVSVYIYKYVGSSQGGI